MVGALGVGTENPDGAGPVVKDQQHVDLNAGKDIESAIAVMTVYVYPYLARQGGAIHKDHFAWCELIAHTGRPTNVVEPDGDRKGGVGWI